MNIVLDVVHCPFSDFCVIYMTFQKLALLLSSCDWLALY
jgi:hypothetical protein